MPHSLSGGLLPLASGETSFVRRVSGSSASFPYSRFAFWPCFPWENEVERFDVAIVGAGPAGSSAAISLARRGYSVILLERALFPREKLCGDFLNPANWELFECLGVADKLLSLEHEKVTAFRISTFLGDDATISFPSRNGKTISGFGLRRSSLDDLLLRQAEKGG